MQTRQQLETTLRALLPQLTAQYHVRWLGYLGSSATGQPGPDSDVNILVELNEPLGWDFLKWKNYWKMLSAAK